MAEYRLPFKPGMRLLEIGGGSTPLIRPNLDIRWLPEVDIVADISYPLPLNKDSFDGILCKYVLEHISWRKVRGFIAEVHRILAPGGVAVFFVPNLLEQARKLIEAKEWNDDLICMVFGDLDYPENSHKAGFSPDYAGKLFREAGFYMVEVLPHPDCLTDMIIHGTKSKARVE